MVADTPTSLLKSALSGPTSSRLSALQALHSATPPFKFLKHLLTHLPPPPLQSLALSLILSNPSRQLCDCLCSLAASLRSHPPAPRDALTYARAAATLCQSTSLHLPAADLLLAAVGSLERFPTSRGPQLRSQTRALSAAYATATRELVSTSQWVSTFFTAAERGEKCPFEAVAALGLLAPVVDGLPHEQRTRFLLAATNLCMKAGADVAKQVARVAACPLREAEQGDVMGTVVPVVERVLLRAPEIALPAAVSFVGALAVDLSLCARKGFFPSVVQAIKSADDKTRAHGVDFAAVLGACVKEPDALVDGVASICAFLKTAKYVYQKVAAVEAITAMACSAVEESRSEEKLLGIEVAVDGVQTWLKSKKETNREARSGAIRALVKLSSTAMTGMDDEEEIPPKVKTCAAFFVDILNGDAFEDRQALLTGMTADLPGSALSAKYVGASGVAALQSDIEKTPKTRHEVFLRACAVLCKWALDDENACLARVDSILYKVLGDCNAVAALFEPSSLTSLSLVRCALFCCNWIIENDHTSSDVALEAVFKLCLDPRTAVSSAAIGHVRSLRGHGTNAERMFMVLWKSQFCGLAGSSSVAKSYDFDDSMVVSEKLGQTLFACVLPQTPESIVPLVLMAANHPRLRQCAEAGRRLPRSRYWVNIERSLEPVRPTVFGEDEEDWLEQSLGVVLGEAGLQNRDPLLVLAALNAVGALADCRNVYSSRVVRTSVVSLRPLALGAARLGKEALEALELVHNAEEQQSALQEVSGKYGGSPLKKAGKKRGGSGASNPRLNQQKQAEIDRARAAHARAIAVAKKADSARVVAREAMKAFDLSRAALAAIHALALVAPKEVHNSTPSVLSLILPLAKFEILEDSCRDTLFALAMTASKRLQPLSVEIGIALYGLERQFDVHANVSNIIDSLVASVPPALQAEDFSLVSPIIRAALVLEEDWESRGKTSEALRSEKRRNAVALAKAAARVLAEHCKREAIDSAIVAAASHAGSWAVQVLEREDGAFAAAADVLSLLTSSALTPGTDHLCQVLEGITSGKATVREAALSALEGLPQLSSSTMVCPRDAVLGRALWLARFDPDEANAELADELWRNYNHPLHVQEDLPGMMALIAHTESDIRIMSAQAIAVALCGKENEGTRKACIPQMFALYLKKLCCTNPQDLALRKGTPSPAKVGSDTLWRENDEKPHDSGWPAREGVAYAIEKMATSKSLDANDLSVCFAFLAGRGLGDSNEQVRVRMSKAATAVVQAAGPLGPSVLLPMIEKQLNLKVASSATAEEIRHADRRRENLVMCLGAVAKFLPSNDSRVSKIAEQVMRSAVETPSEVVQNAAARCLAPLAKASFGPKRQDEVGEYLLKSVWKNELGYGERRGAAYAMAGICKGLGLKYMKRIRIMERIEAAVADKSPRRRQGGLILIETQSVLMGRSFEPYAVAALPLLLSCMGDSIIEVRNACWAAAQATMSEISSQGVKMVLPSLLAALKDRQWRTKAGSADVLGAMAFCAPRQLSQCLPQVVPRLSEALADAHPRVVYAAEAAINRIAAVVRNPEVRMLSPFLLAAFRDPAGRTRGAIDAMLGCEFIHAIDAASLALLIPPLHRGLRDRSSELKKRSAAIVGSMCNNVSNHLDVLPYLDLLLPSLQTTLLDSIPDVRRTSARALGALAVSLGEEGLPNIVPWLIKALLDGVNGSVANATSGERVRVGAVVVCSSAERSGAALGLAEVAASMDDQRLEDVLNRVLSAGQSSAEAKEGGLMLIASMPRALGERFESRLGRALSATLQGLADDTDSVREAALEAGRSLVSAYAKTSLEHLLPVLLLAMRDKLWRIRSAATRLLGDMLLVIAGAHPDKTKFASVMPNAGNGEELKELGTGDDGGSDDDGNESGADDSEDLFASPEQAAAAMTTEATMKAIEQVLGLHRRNDVLAALYIIRCDVSFRVRQTGMQVWKTVVCNTPRVLREIMLSAVGQIVDGLGDEEEERRAAAGKTLGDLSQKLGDHVLPEVLPALKAGITDKSGSERMRRGACEGLGELVLACPKQQLQDHASSLVDAVYQGLCDELPAVRVIAADVFACLLRQLGNAPVDVVVAQLLHRLSTSGEDSERALDALKQVLRASGTRLMAIIVPRLLQDQPIHGAGARALAIAASVGETSFEPHIADVAEAVLYSMQVMGDECLEDLEGVLAAVATCGQQSTEMLLEEVLSQFSAGFAGRRIAVSRTCAAFCRCAGTEVVTAASGSLLEVLIRQLADADVSAAQAASEALLDLSRAVPKQALSTHIPIVRQSLRAAATAIAGTHESQGILGMKLAKASGPVVSILTYGLLYGEPELREKAALGIGEFVELSDAKSLGPSVLKMAGPLIRVMSGRFQWQVKAAVLKALLILLKSTPKALRTFAPQLQSTFVKSLSDDNRLVRKRACSALGALTPVLVRLEGLLNHLIMLSQSEVSAASRSAALQSCCQVFRFGKSLPEAAFSVIPGTIAANLSDEDEEVRRAAGRALGYLAGRAADCNQYVALLTLVLQRAKGEDRDDRERIGALNAIGAIYTAGKDMEGVRYEHIALSVSQVYTMFQSDVPGLPSAACVTSADLLLLLIEGINKREQCKEHKLEVILKLSEVAECDIRPEVRVAALDALKRTVLADNLVISVCCRSLVVCATETNASIREAADRVMRRAFICKTDNSVNHESLHLAKKGLEEAQQRFIDRRIPKLKLLPVSDTEPR